MRTFAVVLRQYYLIRGSLSRVIPLFAWVVVDIVLWGFLTRYLNSVASSPFDFVPVLLGATLLWDFFSRVMHGVTMAFFEMCVTQLLNMLRQSDHAAGVISPGSVVVERHDQHDRPQSRW
jgi:hypothetical protein